MDTEKNVQYMKHVTSKKKQWPNLRNPQILTNVSSLIIFQTPSQFPNVLEEPLSFGSKSKPNNQQSYRFYSSCLAYSFLKTRGNTLLENIS